MSGLFGKGVFISTEYLPDKQCDNCNDNILHGYNLNYKDDFNKTDEVISLLKQK
jgi:hypothetical protein